MNEQQVVGSDSVPSNVGYVGVSRHLVR